MHQQECMASAEPNELERRLAQLEQRVAELESRETARATRSETAAPIAQVSREAVLMAADRTAAVPVASRTLPKADAWFETGEGWLGRAGVGLLAVGFVFLFRYAVDRGWLTPELRIAVGLITGAGLLGAGLGFFADRARFRQILMAGGVVILFMTGLAASELYQIVPSTVALAFHTLVGGIAFGIARRQNDAVMASLGAVGSLVPPGFLLQGSVPGAVLWLHVLLIVVWTGLLYLRNGWPTLLLASAGSTLVATFREVPAESGVRMAAASVLVAAWLAYSILPLIRGVFVSDARIVGHRRRELYFQMPSAMALGLAFSAETFVLNANNAFEVFCLSSAIGFAGVAVWLRTLGKDSFAGASLGAGICAAAAALFGVDAPWNMAVTAALALGALWGARAWNVTVLRWLGHGLYVIVGYALIAFTAIMSQRPAFDSYAIALGLATICAFLGARLVQPQHERPIYLAAVFVAVHVLLALELGQVAGAPWLASVSYGLVGAGLVLRGLAVQDLGVQRAGLVSLALLIGRLFLIDLANVGVGVRILLFMGFGIAFLALSYRFRARKAVA